MSAYGNTAAHVNYDQVQAAVRNALLLRVTLCNCLLVECVEDRLTRQLRNTRVTGNVLHLVNNNGVYDEGLSADLVADLARDDAAQVGSMLTGNAGLQICEQSIIDRISTARDGTQHTAAAYNDVQRLDVEILTCEKVRDQLLTEILLCNDGRVGRDLLGAVTEGLLKQQGLILENTDLSGGGTRVDDQNFM